MLWLLSEPVSLGKRSIYATQIQSFCPPSYNNNTTTSDSGIISSKTTNNNHNNNSTIISSNQYSTHTLSSAFNHNHQSNQQQQQYNISQQPIALFDKETKIRIVERLGTVTNALLADNHNHHNTNNTNNNMSHTNSNTSGNSSINNINNRLIGQSSLSHCDSKSTNDKDVLLIEGNIYIILTLIAVKCFDLLAYYIYICNIYTYIYTYISNYIFIYM